MIYTFHCEECGQDSEADLPINRRNEPLAEACPHCGVKGKISRSFENSGILYDGIKSIHTRAREAAGSDWNSVLKRIHKGAGQRSRIDHD